jgi:hypothetical protein
MKSIKSFYFKIAVLLITLGSMAIFYCYAYHKTFDEKCLPQNTDGIVMVDVKNIRNYFVYSCLKNPSEWKITRTKKKFSFSDLGMETPDYLAFFHIENQPISQWFVTGKIENETAFEKAITKSHFRKTAFQNRMGAYYSYSLNLCIIKYSDQILVSNISEKQKQLALKIAEDLFLKNLFLDPKKIEKTIATSNEATLWIKKNNLLEEDGIININLNESEIAADGQLQIKSKYRKESQFSLSPNALLSLGLNFEMIRKQEFITENSAKINKMIGFNLDSILIHNPSKTELVLHEIIEKKDSAISYEYDDDFNPVKKVVVHTRREPAFSFSMQTENSKKVFNYLKSQNTIDNHNLFVNFPLAPTKIFTKNTVLTLEANLSKQLTSKSSQHKIAYFQMHFNKLRPKDWNFLIGKNKNFQLLKSFESLEIGLAQENNQGHFEARLKRTRKL